jgi:hypothetical protein
MRKCSLRRRHVATAIFAIPLALVGALIRVATDFTVATIYKA